MKKLFTLLIAVMTLTTVVNSQELIITGVVDGDLSGGLPKVVELYVVNDIADMSVYSIGVESNGAGTVTTKHTFAVGTATAGDFITIAEGDAVFNGYMGYDADVYTGVGINGNDIVVIQNSGTTVDMFGESGQDGTGEAWEYKDGWAYRVSGTGPDATFVLANWTAANGALDGFSTNAAADNSFPSKSYSPVGVVDTDAPVWEAAYPMAEVEDVQFDLLAQLDETSKVYYVVLADGATAPTVDEVKAGTGSAAAVAVVAGSFTAGTSETAETITGLLVETSYDVYVVAEDDEASPNVQDAVSLVEITTVVIPDVLMQATFETDLSPFTAVSVSGEQVWAKSPYGGYAAVTGYVDGSNYANEDWLVSPGIDLAAATGEVLSFESANNFGNENTTLQVKIASDFSGTYDAASIAAATWTDITDQFTLSSGGSWDFVASGNVDFTPYAETGTGYLAFVYVCPDASAGTWEIDNVLYTGFLADVADATLSDLTVDGTTIDGFDAATLSYSVELPVGTTTIPVIAGTTTNDMAEAVMTPATDLTGDAAERTATLTVTAQDGTTTQDYTVVFNPILAVDDLGVIRASYDDSRKYIVTGEVVLTFQQSNRNKKYVQDANGAIEIDDYSGIITSTYAIGDGITGLVGTVAEYKGMLQFSPSADPGVASSHSNNITAIVATPAQINADPNAYEGYVVKVESVTFDEADGSAIFVDGQNYTLQGVVESLICRTGFYGVIPSETVIPDSAHVTGIIVQYFDDAQITPRSGDDIVELIPYIVSDDATLSALVVDGTGVSGFSPAALSYYVTLEAGTTSTPVVTATATADGLASVVIADASDVTSTDVAARTTTVTVTAEDGIVEKSYTIEFTVEVGIASNRFDHLNVYPVPASDQLYISGASSAKRLTVYDITGSVVREMNDVQSGLISIDVSALNNGVYIIKLENDNATGIVRFVKQ